MALQRDLGLFALESAFSQLFWDFIAHFGETF